ncbi:hypothetical protein C0992_001345 [Termitomyces sp. T32_za158]|nr:hypothetical protein C0992_001345 [Termitomyces sp. T32_za158]
MFLTAEERRKHDRKLADVRSQGVVIGKRKTRSDKGKSRTKGPGPRSKKKKMSQLPPGPAYKSAEFIDDEDDESQADNADKSEASGTEDDN